MRSRMIADNLISIGGDTLLNGLCAYNALVKKLGALLTGGEKVSHIGCCWYYNRIVTL